MPPLNLRRIVPRGLRLRSKMRWKNGRWRLATPDRVFLEDVIVPGLLADHEIRTVLDIGVAWYTKSYPKLFRGVDYWTIDVDPAAEDIASAQHHTLSATKLTEKFSPGQFDLIMCNGVFGWGLNTPEDVETALEECAAVLRPDGWLVVGWNDMNGRRVAGLSDLFEKRFRRETFAPVGDDHFIPATPYAHRFDFLRRR